MENDIIPKEETSVSPKKAEKGGFSDMTNKIRENPWILSSLVLGIFVLVLVVPAMGMTGNVVSEKVASENFINFAKTQVPGIAVANIEEKDGFYSIDYTSSQGDSSVYMTLDGKFLIGGLIPLTEEIPTGSDPTSTEVPKTDKPIVDLFVWAYCPYGVQAQGPLAEVASLLGDKVDFNVVLYHDGHGAFETQQNKIQACIQKLDKDKYWAYAEKFVSDIYPVCSQSRDVTCDLDESVKLMKSLGIDSDKVLACVESDGEDLTSEYSALAQKEGVTGSPTLMINGVIVQPSSRTADAFKTSICSSFNDAPEECGEVLDATAVTTAGNC